MDSKRFSDIFLAELPSTKQLYISLACLFFCGCMSCIFARLHDLYFAELCAKDELITRWGCYISLLFFVGASIIPAAPIRAAFIAIYTVCGFPNENREATPLIIENVIPTSFQIHNSVVSLAKPHHQNTTTRGTLCTNNNPALIRETKFPLNDDNAMGKKKKTTHKKSLPVSIDRDRFENVFALWYIKNYNVEYQDIICGLESKTWTKTQLCQVALLIHRSQILKPEYSTFRSWLKEFFKSMGRNDCPEKANRNDYLDFTKSSDDISNYFRTLTIRYKKTTDSMLILTNKAKQLC